MWQATPLMNGLNLVLSTRFINYTILAQKKGRVEKDGRNINRLLSLDVVREFWNEFSFRANAEVVEKFGKISFDESHAAKEFFDLTGIELSSIKLSDAGQMMSLQEQFSNDKKVYEFCLMQYILKKIKNNPTILRSDPVNHISQFRSAHGVSGSIENAECFNTKLRFDPMLSIGTKGQILDNLLRKKSRVELCEDRSPLKLLKNQYDFLKTQYEHSTEHHNLHAFIDAGAFFKGTENDDIARTFANFFGNESDSKINHILFFNDKDELCALPIKRGPDGKAMKLEAPILIGTSDPKIILERTGSSPEQCFTYYDQRHTRGTDIKQALNAVALLTVDKDTLAKDYEQAAMRMRDLAGSHQVITLLPSDVAVSHPEIKRWNEENIIQLTEENQFKNLAPQHFQAALQNINNTIREKLKSIILHQKESKEKSRLLGIFSEFFFVELKDDPLQQFGSIEKRRKTNEILDEIRQQKLDTMNKLLEQAGITLSMAESVAIEAELFEIAEKYKAICLDTTKHVPKPGEGTTAIVEKVKEKEKEKEKEREIEKKKEFEKGVVEARNYIWGLSSRDLASLVASKDAVPALYEINEVLVRAPHPPRWRFDKNILASENYLFSFKGQDNPMDAYRKPVMYYLYIQEPPPDAKSRAILLCEEEAEEIVNKINTGQYYNQIGEAKAWVISPQGSILNKHSELPEGKGYNRIREQICFYNGDLDIIGQNPEIIDWIDDINLNEKLQYLTSVILPYYPEKEKKAKFLVRAFEIRGLIRDIIQLVKANDAKSLHEKLAVAIKSYDKEVLRSIFRSVTEDGEKLFSLILRSGSKDVLELVESYVTPEYFRKEELNNMNDEIVNAALDREQTAYLTDKIAKMKSAGKISNEQYSSYLFRALVGSKLESFTSLLTQLQNFDEKDRRDILNNHQQGDYTLLTYAIKNIRNDFLKSLVDQSFLDPNVTDKNGNFPLKYALNNARLFNYYDTINILLQDERFLYRDKDIKQWLELVTNNDVYSDPVLLKSILEKMHSICNKDQISEILNTRIEETGVKKNLLELVLSSNYGDQRSKALQFLLKEPLLDYRDLMKGTSLQEAIKKDDPILVKQAIEEGTLTLPDAKDVDEWFRCLKAAIIERNSPEYVELILNKLSVTCGQKVITEVLNMKILLGDLQAAYAMMSPGMAGAAGMVGMGMPGMPGMTGMLGMEPFQPITLLQFTSSKYPEPSNNKILELLMNYPFMTETQKCDSTVISNLMKYGNGVALVSSLNGLPNYDDKTFALLKEVVSKAGTWSPDGTLPQSTVMILLKILGFPASFDKQKTEFINTSIDGVYLLNKTNEIDYQTFEALLRFPGIDVNSAIKQSNLLENLIKKSDFNKAKLLISVPDINLSYKNSNGEDYWKILENKKTNPTEFISATMYIRADEIPGKCTELQELLNKRLLEQKAQKAPKLETPKAETAKEGTQAAALKKEVLFSAKKKFKKAKRAMEVLYALKTKQSKSAVKPKSKEKSQEAPELPESSEPSDKPTEPGQKKLD